MGKTKNNFQNVPDAMKKIPRWVVYRKFPNPENPAKDKKVAYLSKSPRTPAFEKDEAGRVDRMLSWSSFEDAVAACNNPKNKLDGIGWDISAPYVAADWDADDVDAGTLDLIRGFESYAEVSPSGDGFHLILHGVPPRDPRDPSPAPKSLNIPQGVGRFEIYSRDRWFTVTGAQVEGTPSEIRECEKEVIGKLYAYSKKSEAILEARKTKLTDDQKLALLMAGQIVAAGFEDPTGDNRADYCLCCLLRDKFGDREKVRELWLQSGLKRKKLERKDYVESTLDEAFKNFQPNKQMDPDSWPTEFLPLSDIKVPEHAEIVTDLLIKDGVHIWAGLFESYKTMFAQELSSAILEQRPAFDHFAVKSFHEVLYLCPDMPPSLLLKYARNFRLDKQGAKFRVLRPDSDIFITLDNPLLQRAVKDRILFLDTMLDYARVKDAFRSEEWVEFFQKLRNLIRVHGCAAIVLITHPTKSGARNSIIDATEYLKDSVTVGGKTDVGLAFRKVDRTSKVFIERIKGRGFERKITFTVSTHDENGDSYLSRGRFPVFDKPEEQMELGDHLAKQKPGRKSECSEEKLREILRLRKEGKSDKEIGEQYGVSYKTVSNWVKNADSLF